MATATVTATDCEDGTVQITIEYGDAGVQEDSMAHQILTAAVQQALELLKGDVDG